MPENPPEYFELAQEDNAINEKIETRRTRRPNQSVQEPPPVYQKYVQDNPNQEIVCKCNGSIFIALTYLIIILEFWLTLFFIYLLFFKSNLLLLLTLEKLLPLLIMTLVLFLVLILTFWVKYNELFYAYFVIGISRCTACLIIIILMIYQINDVEYYNGRLFGFSFGRTFCKAANGPNAPCDSPEESEIRKLYEEARKQEPQVQALLKFSIALCIISLLYLVNVYLTYRVKRKRVRRNFVVNV